ncbi:MAG TPA: MFS transporter [Acidiferrobacter sp.]|nr:MFS transporter [Acidiferrobacter sp.]
MSRKTSKFDDTMSPQEKQTAYSLAGIYAVRMLGLFMILPVFTVYGQELKGHTPFLIGLAIGIYGLTQALLQIPFGMLSDRIGRKAVIMAGLVIFAVGSVVAALSHSIEGVIIGRALQGAGAISSTVMALAADLTRDEHRTKIMATIGVSIGVAFSAGMVLGPVLNTWIGVAGIFWVTAVMAIMAMGIVIWGVPTPRTHLRHRDTEVAAESFGQVLRNKELLRLDFGIFIMQFVLTSNFVVMPLLLSHLTGIPIGKSWELYLPIMVLAFIAMVPLIIIAEKRRKMRSIFLGAVAVLALANFSYTYADESIVAMAIGLWVFFTAFNVLEASLPSLVAKVSPPAQKGTAMGIYSTSQFLGIFAGGVSGGALYGHWGINGDILTSAVLVLVWLAVATGMKEPRYFASYVLQLAKMTPNDSETLRAAVAKIPGVMDIAMAPDEGVAYLRIDRATVDEEQLRAFSGAHS